MNGVPGCVPPLLPTKDQARNKNEKTQVIPGQGIHAECKINRQGQKLSPSPRGQRAGSDMSGSGGTSSWPLWRYHHTRESRGRAPGRQSWVSAGLFPSGKRGRRVGTLPCQGHSSGEYEPRSWTRTLGNTDLHNRGSPLRKPDLAGSVPSLPLTRKQPLLL